MATSSGVASFNTTTAHGVVVQATASENVTHLAIAAGGGFVGIAGGVAITLIDSDTRSWVENNARINRTADNAGASNQQGVTLRAGNRIETFSFAGGLAGGFVGVGGAVDIGSIKNDTAAFIKSGADVAARGNVLVGAHHLDKNFGFTLALGGGVVGIGAAVSVWSIGTPLSANYQNSQGSTGSAFSANGGDQQNKAADQGGGMNNRVAGQMGGYSGGNTNDNKTDANERLSGIGKSAQTSLNTRGPSGTSLRALIASNATPAGTQAYIEGGATVRAGGGITVDAKDRTEAQFIGAGGGGGLVGVGATIRVLNLANNARASAGGYLFAGGQIRVNGEVIENVEQTSVAFGGGFVGLGASVSVINDTSTAHAFIADGATIDNAGSIFITATSNQTLDAFTTSVQGGAAAIGASFTRIAIGNSSATDTYAGIGSNVMIGQGSGSVGDITIQAKSRISATLDTFAMAGGVVGLTFNFAYADITPDVRATIGAGTRINSTGAIRVLSGTDHYARTEVFGLSVGGLAAGLSLARSNLDATVSAEVGGQIAADSILISGRPQRRSPESAGNPPGRGWRHPGCLCHRRGTSRGHGHLQCVAGHGHQHGRCGGRGQCRGGVEPVAGALGVRANGISQSIAVGRAISVSLAGMGLLNSRAVASGTNRSSLGAGARVNAGTLLVQSDGIDHADSDNDSTDISGLGNIGFSFSKAEVNPTVTAHIGEGASVDIAGTLALRANSMSDGDAKAHRTGLSLGLDFGMIKGDSVVSPTASATVDSSAASPTVVNAGTIDIQARHGSPVSVSDGTLASIDTSADLLVTAGAWPDHRRQHPLYNQRQCADRRVGGRSLVRGDRVQPHHRQAGRSVPRQQRRRQQRHDPVRVPARVEHG